MKTLVCDNCGHEDAHLRYLTRSYGKGETLLVIENVPVVSCPSCGESYLSAETLHSIDRIRRHRKELSESRAVDVARFVA